LAGVGRETFVAESWLRRDGDLADRATAEARPGFARSGPWLEARADGLTVLVPRAPDAGRPPGPADIARRCQPGVVIVLPAGASDPLSGATNRRSRSGAELRPVEGAATRAPAHKPTTPAPVSAASARPPASAPAPGLACIVLSAADLAARGPAAIHATPRGPRVVYARDASASRPWGRVPAAFQ
jgi:hypothetical protein